MTDKEQVYLNRQIEQMTYLQGQQDHQSIDTQIRFAEKQLKQDMDHVAFEILQGLLELTEDDHAHHTKCLILLSQIFLKHGQTKRAIVTLEAAMDLAKKNFNARNYYWAAIKLAQAYITLKEKDKATFILESSIPMVYSLGDTALASEMDVVCSSLEALS
ncbi:hypothetical protein DM01DRAFT_1023170 [Hesseltinella vesiculosa]|uniref:Tetratricopeptide repeat protein n=1 Tax=Hesseltinella vesiculosa TaxID=101127 RepID=A0A1X2GJY3_9FUNG|nr:hypothetical protein DM01DRAFT_1023170 [Hesseltinella vesiculosa]